MVLRADLGGATGGYSELAPFPPMTTDVLACALLNDETLNPICTNASMIPNIVSELEERGSNPAAKADMTAFEGSVSYSGTQLAPVATYSTSRAGWCAMYAKNVSSGTPVVAFANTSSISIELNRVTDTLTLYACCGLSQTNNNPVGCAASQLFSTVVDIGAARTAATADIFNGLNAAQNGQLTFGATQGERCDNYEPGFNLISTGNENQTGGLNCTCTNSEEDSYTFTWDCVAPYPAAHMMWGGSSAAIIIGTLVGSIVVLLLGCACIGYRKMTQPRPKGLPNEIAHVGVAQQEQF
jgi:hypothetical protein